MAQTLALDDKGSAGGGASPRQHIFVGIPSGDARSEMEIGVFLASLGQPNPRYNFTLRPVVQVSPVAYARNILARECLKTTAERLWMVDSDTMPPANAFDLLDVEGDIVAAACPVGDFGQNLFFNGYLMTPEGPMPAQIGDGSPMEVDAVGFASVVISRRLLEDPRLRLPAETIYRSWRKEPYVDKAPGIFRMVYGTDGSIVVGEDLDFCMRARDLGYKVVFVPGVRFDHRKRGPLMGMLRGIYESYARGREDEALEAQARAAKSERRIVLA